MKFFHGTSYENYLNIVKNGFNVEKPLTWLCSEINKTYLWGCDDESEGLCRAKDSGLITAALQNSQEHQVIVLEFDLKDDEEILPDYSCENMEDAYCIENKLLNLHNFVVHNFSYNPELRPFYLIGCNKMYLNVEDNHLKETLELIEKSSSIDDICISILE